MHTIQGGIKPRQNRAKKDERRMFTFLKDKHKHNRYYRGKKKTNKKKSNTQTKMDKPKAFSVHYSCESIFGSTFKQTKTVLNKS
jgi:uncharacterized Rmd1/YagE family protein